jgi:uncharacterized protein YfbU (UPF0304 family)
MKLTKSERLILVMLSAICKKLDIRDSIDPDFVLETIHKDQTWALDWECGGLFGDEPSSDTPPRVNEIIDILDMWDRIEDGYKHLSQPEKQKLKEDSKYPREIIFGGFDANSEGEHYATTRFLIDHLERFPDFKGRDLNTHYPVLDSYKRMLPAFERIGGVALGRRLNTLELIKILNARLLPDPFSPT